MAGFLMSRRRLIARHGRPMTIRRQTGVNPVVFSAVEVAAAVTAFRPEQLIGGVQQGDMRAEILNDEIADAAWPGPPRAKDSLLVDGKAWQIVGATPVFDGALCIGHALWIRGGA